MMGQVTTLREQLLGMEFITKVRMVKEIYLVLNVSTVLGEAGP